MWPFRILILLLAISLTKSEALSEFENEGEAWAFLVAGSSGWNNYRHQTHVYQAYKILHKNGIPDERIVVMMSDDIAYNEQNPHSGVVINQINGKDISTCVPMDYTGSAVTEDVFLKVLQGESTELGSGKVIQSGPNDNIFVFLALDGAPGIIKFNDTFIQESKFISTLNKMYDEKKYAKMLIYIEGCNSGSMVTRLPRDTNVFAVTATSETENSYACCYDRDLKTFLGDVFSKIWMEISEKVSLKRTTVREQYDMVKKQVNTSHVQKFGDMSIGEMKLSDFLGSYFDLQTAAHISEIPDVLFFLSNSNDYRDMSLEILIKKLPKESTEEEKENLRRYFSEYFESVRKMKIYDFQDSEFDRQTSAVNSAIPKAIFDSTGEKKRSDCRTSESDLHTPTDNSAVPNAQFDFRNSVNSRDVALTILMKKLENATTQEKENIERNLYEYSRERDLINSIFRDIVQDLTQENELVKNLLSNSEEITNTKCYEEAVENFLRACLPYRHSQHVLEHLKTFVNLCNEKFYIGHITDATNRVCSAIL